MMRLFTLLFGEPGKSKAHNVFEEVEQAFPVLLLISVALVWALWVTTSIASRDR